MDVLHLRSNLLSSGKAKAPIDLPTGKIALNYKSGYESLFIKNDAGSIVALNDWSKILNKPTTLGGYGITDAATSSHTHTFASLTSKPTTLAGYGITDLIVRDGDVIMNTNPFGGRPLYINSIDNAMYAANKKWYVEVTIHARTHNSESYPKLNPDWVESYTVTGSGTSFTVIGSPTSIIVYNGDTLCTESISPSNQNQYKYSGGVLTFGATVAGTVRVYPGYDVRQYIDSPVVNTLSSQSAFDGSYESALAVSTGYYMKINVKFNQSGTAGFGGYPYGRFFLSYYYTATPDKAEYRVYNRTYRPHGIGWKKHDFTDFKNTNTSGSYIQSYNDGGNYGRSEIEFIIYGHPSHTTQLTQIDLKLDRPNLSANGATVTKYGVNKLYYDLQFGNQTANNLVLYASGDISAKKVTANNYSTGYDWTQKTSGYHCGVDGVSGGVSFYDNVTSYSAAIYREASTSILYVGARSGVRTNGLAIDYLGNIGVGTPSPTYKLDVFGSTRVGNSISDGLTIWNGTKGVTLTVDESGNLKVDGNLYATGEVSAYGSGSGSGSGSGIIQSVLGSAGLGGSYSDTDLTNTFNAYTINLISNNLTSAIGRIGALETSTPNVAWGTPTTQLSPLTINAITRSLSVDGHTHDYLSTLKVGTTSYSVSGNSITIPAYPTTLPASDVYSWAKASVKPSYSFSEIGSKPTTLSGYGITDALNTSSTSQTKSGGLTISGTLTANSNIILNGVTYNMLTLARTTANGSSILFKNSSGNLGKLGFDGGGNLIVGKGETTDGVADLLKIATSGAATFYSSVTASSFIGNASSATKLQTSRTIWGQNFDGSGNISGDLNGVSSIIRNHAYAVDSDVYGNLNWKAGAESWFNWNVGGILNVNKGGNVGIGIGTPSSKLHVIGEVKIESHNSTTGAINIQGNSTSCGFGFGNTESVNNMGFIKFKPTAVNSGSVSNRIAFDIYGNDDIVSILGNGNVGIGTTSPSYKLDVNGTSRFSDTILAKNLIFNSNNTWGNLGSVLCTWGNNGGYPTLYGSSDDRWIMHINPHISYVQNGVGGYTGSLNGSTIRFAGNTAANVAWDLGVGCNSVGSDKFSVGRSASSFVSIDNSGNVGVGITDAQYKLDVRGSFYAFSATVAGSITFHNDQTERFIRSNAYGGAIRLRGDSSSASDRGIQLGRVDNNLSFTSFLNINANSGNVSIGSTADNGYKLDVAGAFRVNHNYSTIFTGNDINFTRTDGSSYINAGQTLSLGAGGVSGVLNITNGNVATFKELLLADGVRIHSNAGAGLGISLFAEPSFNPNYGLMFAQTVYKGKHGAVNGDWATYFTMSPDAGRGWIFTSNAAGTGGNVASISNWGNLTCSGEVTAYSASDRRLKTDIVTLRDSLRIIELLNPVSYKWNSIAKELNPMKGDEKDYGLIAQELECVMPELVHSIYDGKYKSIDYVKLIPHLVCAIKELKMEVDRLKK